MIEKKEFLIPKTIDEGVKLFGDIKAGELIKTLSVPLILSALTFYLPIGPFVKLGVVAGLIIIPGYLIADRPVRKNITVMYHLKAWIRYELRQKELRYEKERYYETISEVEDQGTETKTDSAKIHTIKSRVGRVIDYDRKQINQTVENHEPKYGTYE
ncbi:hypothetical protein [Peribacillus frigoritolerans]|uniref:hypothetical protein n=1 Tax=Peribacillus frigoritolerans TaxID=450367 RepID=UPI0023DB08FF|nr:hypothetical protein [Peribacillus frigoritolerans]MDF1995807.1 hypothetical protein [Peribacillus frigoritolerans]